MTTQEYFETLIAKNGNLLAGFVSKAGVDPCSVISAEEYGRLMVHLMSNHSILFSQKSMESSDTKLFFNNEILHKKINDLTKRRIDFFAYQDELLFINEGADISYYPIQYGFPAHWHKNAYFDVAYVFSGVARFYFKGEIVELHEGDFLIVPPESEHGNCVLTPDSYAITCSIRCNVFIRSFMTLFSDNVFLQTFFVRILSGEESIPYLRFDTAGENGEIDTALRELFVSLMAEQDKKAPYYHKMIDAIMSTILVHLLRYHEKKLILPNNALYSWKPEYDDIFHYIKQKGNNISIDELAAHFHYSKRQLIRIFRKCTGQSYSQLMRNARMHQAKELLEGTTLSVEEVAHRCGYESLSSFIRSFSNFYKCTPSAYRQKTVDADFF